MEPNDIPFGELSINITNVCNMPTGIQVLNNTECKHEHEISRVLLIWNENCIFMYDASNGINAMFEPFHIFELSHCTSIIQVGDFILFLNKNEDLFAWNKKKFYDSSVSIVMAIDEPLNDDPGKLNRNLIKPELVMEGVLAMCYVRGNQVCLLIVAGDDLSINLCSLISQDTAATTSPSFRMENHYLCSITSKSTKDTVETCLLTYIHCSEMNRKLSRQLCPSLSIEKSDIVVISVGSGQIVSISVTGMPSTQSPHLIFSSYHRATSILYENETDEPCLFIALSNNCVVRITSGEKRLVYKRYSCISNYVVCRVLPTVFLTSDGNRTWQTSIDQTEVKNVPLSIRGVYIACKYEEGKLLIITKHGAAYWINLPQYVELQEDVASCNSTVLIEHVRKVSLELLELENDTEDEDAALKELSVIKRLPYLSDFFTITVKVHDAVDSNYNFEIQIFNKSEISLTAKFWFVQTRIKGCAIDFSQTHNLSVDFNEKSIIRIVSKCKIKKLSFPLILECRLISMFNLAENDTCATKSDYKSLRCSVLLGRVTLDISYFCTPISSAANVQEYTQEDFGDQQKLHLQTITCNLKDDTSLNTIAQVLSKHCAHRGMNALRNSSNLSLRIGSSKIDITMKDKEAVFSSYNKQYLLQVQDCLGEKKTDVVDDQTATVDVDPMIILEAQAAQLGLDLIDAQTLEGRMDTEASLLHNVLRKRVIFPLPLPS